MSNNPIAPVSVAGVLLNYLLTGFGRMVGHAHEPGVGMPADTVRLDHHDVVLGFTCVAPPMFRDKAEALASARSIDVVVVRCYAESFDALPAIIEVTLARGGLAPFTLHDLTLYRHDPDGTLWFVPATFGAAVKLTGDGLELHMTPPYETTTERMLGVYRSTAQIAVHLYPQVIS